MAGSSGCLIRSELFAFYGRPRLRGELLLNTRVNKGKVIRCLMLCPLGFNEVYSC